MKECEHGLNINEINRNKHGSMLYYTYSLQSQGSVTGIHSFKTIPHSFCNERFVWNEHELSSTSVNSSFDADKSRCEVFVPGFPTMKLLKYSVNTLFLVVRYIPVGNNTFSFKSTYISFSGQT